MSARYTPAERLRIEKQAERLGISRTRFLRHIALLGLREVERTSDLIESPVVGALLQMFADFGADETAAEFRRIRHQLQSIDDSGEQQKLPFNEETSPDLGIDCGLS